MTALQAPGRKPDERPRRRGLTQVQLPARRMASVPFVLAVAVFLGLGSVGLLLLNTALQEQGFAVQAQQKTANQLGYQVAALESEVTEARSSAKLAEAAATLGMVPNPYPVYLSLPAAKIVGDPTKLTGSELPDVRYRTPEELAKLTERMEKAEAKRLADLKAAAAKKKAEAAKQRAAEARQRAEEQARREGTGR